MRVILETERLSFNEYFFFFLSHQDMTLFWPLYFFFYLFIYFNWTLITLQYYSDFAIHWYESMPVFLKEACIYWPISLVWINVRFNWIIRKTLICFWSFSQNISLGENQMPHDLQPGDYAYWKGSGVSQVALVVKNPPANAGDLRDVGLIPRSGRSPGEGHGNSVQCSCLENPIDRGAWWATVYGVAKSQTRLKWLSMHTHTFRCLCLLRKEIEETQKREQCVTLRESHWRGNKNHKLITAVLLVLQAFLVFTMYRTFSVDR